MAFTGFVPINKVNAFGHITGIRMISKEKDIILNNDLSSGRIAQKIVSEFNKEIKNSLYMTDGIKTVNMKSIIGILSSGFTFGSKVTLVSVCDDSDIAEYSLEKAADILSRI